MLHLSREITHANRAPIKVVLTGLCGRLVYAIATWRQQSQKCLPLTPVGDASTARPRSCYCMYVGQDRSPDLSATTSKIAPPFADDGSVCCRWRLFTLSMSRPRRRRRVECQFGITRLLRPLNDAGGLRAARCLCALLDTSERATRTQGRGPACRHNGHRGVGSNFPGELFVNMDTDRHDALLDGVAGSTLSYSCNVNIYAELCAR